MTILIFLLVLFVLVLVHEFGHFIMAKKTGMRVDEFGIGFPPKLFGVKKGETEYTFNLFPIGGFVKIAGEDGSEATSVASDPVRREAEDHPMSQGDEGEGGTHSKNNGGLFTEKSRWAQSLVLVAGVTMNILFAWFLFALALGIGVQTAVDEGEVTNAAELVVTEVLPDSPASEAGLPQGAVITGVYGNSGPIETLRPSSFSELTERSTGEELTVSYLYGGTEGEVVLTSETGLIDEDRERYAVGIALSMVETVSKPIHTAVYEGLLITIRSLRDITVGISGLIWDALRFKADFSQVAGPVGIVGLVGEASAFGITTLLMFTAFISLNLAIINLLPFPALDGGRLLFVIIEGIKGSPLNVRYVQVLNTIGFALLILLMVAVTYNDISRIW